MCLSVYFNTRRELREFKKGKIADKDITVYKALNRLGYGPWQGALKYKKGYEYYNEGKNSFTFITRSWGTRKNGDKQWQLSIYRVAFCRR